VPAENIPVHTTTPEETEAIGAALAKTLSGGAILALHGDLGAGKTVFSRGIARGLGIDEPVCSPTFTVVQEYQGTRWRFYHVDLYRLQGVDDALAFGLEDYLEDPDAIIAIEWSERISELLSSSDVVHVTINHSESGRNVRVSTGRLESSDA
jgi:tRNA threonylcarbamoyladenosine biosynthesis protein TsaE